MPESDDDHGVEGDHDDVGEHPAGHHQDPDEGDVGGVLREVVHRARVQVTLANTQIFFIDRKYFVVVRICVNK